MSIFNIFFFFLVRMKLPIHSLQRQTLEHQEHPLLQALCLEEQPLQLRGLFLVVADSVPTMPLKITPFLDHLQQVLCLAVKQVSQIHLTHLVVQTRHNLRLPMLHLYLGRLFQPLPPFRVASLNSPRSPSSTHLQQNLLLDSPLYLDSNNNRKYN